MIRSLSISFHLHLPEPRHWEVGRRIFGLAAVSAKKEPARAEVTAIDTDLELLQAGCRGDDAAFRRLVENHQQRLLTVCERLLGSAEEAQNVVQETFLQAFRKGESFRPNGQVGAWLYRIAVNLCLRQLRRRRLVQFVGFVRPGEPGPSLEATVDRLPDPEQQAEIRRRWQTTRRLIDSLPDGQRTVLILARFEGLSIRAIADILGMTEKAVEGRLSRGVEKLRTALNQTEAGRD